MKQMPLTHTLGLSPRTTRHPRFPSVIRHTSSKEGPEILQTAKKQPRLFLLAVVRWSFTRDSQGTTQMLLTDSNRADILQREARERAGGGAGRGKTNRAVGGPVISGVHSTSAQWEPRAICPPPPAAGTRTNLVIAGRDGGHHRVLAHSRGSGSHFNDTDERQRYGDNSQTWGDRWPGKAQEALCWGG